MKIIIIGCGKVGYDLAKQLSEENHEITLIDTNAEKLDRALATLDVQGIEGNGTTFRAQIEAGGKECDLLIAMTGEDEVNLLCSLIGKKVGAKHTIARVRNPIYNEEIGYLSDEMGLSLAINPELSCARYIAKLLEIPSALDISSFANGRIDFIKLPIAQDSPVDGLSVYEFATNVHSATLICAVVRDGEVIIPNGSTRLLAGDDMYVIAPPQELHRLLPKLGIKAKPIRSVMIAGGGKTGFYLAKHIEGLPMDVKILEIDRERCEYLSENLPGAMIINGNAADREILMEEGLDSMDAFVTLTSMDEENLVLSLFSSKVGKAKTIAKLSNISFGEVIAGLPVDVVVNPKEITAKSILQYVRALQNSRGSNVESLYRILDGRVEALEFIARSDSRVVDIPLMELKLKKNLLICAIVRHRKVITPGGKDRILAGDHVVVVTTNKGLKDIGDILQ